MNNNRHELNNCIASAEKTTTDWANEPVSEYLDTIASNVKNVRQQVSAIENNKTGKEALENKQLYNDAIKKSDELNNDLQQIKQD